MALEKFTLETLVTMDGGRIGNQLLKAIQRLEADCRDRPAEVKKRAVAMIFEMQPTYVMDGGRPTLDTIEFGVRWQEKIPPRRTRIYSARPLARGGMAYNDESPDDADQMTLGRTPDRPKVLEDDEEEKPARGKA